ncbi:lipase secretion chaperone [Massilia cavernae]|nr:lipase secretion chaperone [Massilia cavernae]
MMKLKTAHVAGGMAAVVAAIFVGVAWFAHEDEAPAAKVVEEENLFAFVRPMDGMQPEAWPKPDAAGTVEVQALVINTDLRQLFDHFLAEQGEKSLNEVRAEAEREIEHRLQPGPAAEAKHLLGRYLDYQRALENADKEALPADGTMATLHAQAEAMRYRRARFLSAQEVQGLFGPYDPLGPHALAKLELYQDPALSNEQKAEKIAALDAHLQTARATGPGQNLRADAGNKVSWRR